MSTDAELLRRYAEDKSEAAFAELVRLHLNLVYFAALRQVGGDVHRAKDVAQTVFTDLARKATALTGRDTLTGWLHTSTRFAAAKARRADFTRQHHEQEASTMNALLQPDPAAEWERLRPMIDDAIHELDERDREAVLLRFFESRPFAEIGATLHLSEDAARMRVDRALEKLRAALARRGVKSTGAALAAVFANQVTAAAPAGLAASITGAALAGAAAGTTVLMSTSTAILTAVALAATGATVYQWTHVQRAEAELAALLLERDSLRSDLNTQLQQAKRSAKDVAALQGEVDSLKAKQAALAAAPRPAPLPQVAALPTLTPEQQAEIRRASLNKAIFNNLRQFSAARSAFQKRYGRPPSSIDELVGEDKFIRKLTPVDGENYATLPLGADQPLVVTNSDGGAVSYDPSASSAASAPPRELSPEEQHVRDMAQRLKPAISQATEAYRTTHNGAAPTDPNALLPYFATPQEGADYVEFLGIINAGPGRVK